MKGKNRKWQDLLDNSVDVETIDVIAKDVKQSHIFNLGIGIKKFQIRNLKLPPIPPVIHKDNVTMDFTEKVRGDYHELEAIMTVRVSCGFRMYEIQLKGFIRGNYDYPPLSYRMQDYLFTYMCASIRRHPKLKEFRPWIRLPESLSSCMTSKLEWDRVVQTRLNWIEDCGLHTVEQLDTSPEIPNILITPADLKNQPLSANEENWEETEAEFHAAIQDIYEREKKYRENKISLEGGEMNE